ncbi:MAG TPA: carboxypeptidase-like regulatory domain-containing protein [Limnobacter sp.]|nr:carboxypeptidase-like regulatory domain-containing protein [Limnobacter sp.]
MKMTYKQSIWAVLLSMVIVGCGGGDGGSSGSGVGESGNGGGNGSGSGENGGGTGGGGGNNGGGTGGGGTNTPRVTLRGVAAQGGPLAGVTITVIGAGSNAGTVTTTAANGSYTADVTGLTPPLRVFASSNRTNEAFALTSVAFAGEQVAHINEATHAITQSMGSNPSQARRDQLSTVMQETLTRYFSTYQVTGEAGNFFASPSYVPDSLRLDGVFHQVRISYVGNGILLESRAAPTFRQTIDTRLNFPVAEPLNMIPGDNDVNPRQLRDAVIEFRDSLLRPGDAPSKLERSLHADFKDNNGLDMAALARLSTERRLTIENHEVLRCYPNTADILDRCMVRLWLKSTRPNPTFDFGNPRFAEVESTEAYDLMIERRPEPSFTGVGTITGPIRFAGGQFRPNTANIKLLHMSTVTLGANGSQTTATPTRSLLQLDMQSPLGAQTGVSPLALANANVRGANLQQTVNNTATTLLGVTRPANGQCTGVGGLVRNPVANADCGNTLAVSDLGALEVQSRNNQLSLAVLLDNVTNPVSVPSVRIRRGASLNDAFFPELNEASRTALHAYGRSNTPPTALNITLTPPTGFNSVCIGTNLSNLDDSVCVRASRAVSIPNAQLPARSPQYYVFTTDNEGHRFVKQYNLQ